MSFLLPFAAGVLLGSYAYESIAVWMLYVVAIYALICCVYIRDKRKKKISLFILMCVLGLMRMVVEMQSIRNDSELSDRREILYASRNHSLYAVSGLYQVSRSYNDRLLEMYENAGLKNPENVKGTFASEYAVVTAMTLGRREWISESLREDYSRSGAAHALALSGMHLAIVYAMVFFLLKRIFGYLYLLPDKLISCYGYIRACCWIIQHRWNPVYIFDAIHCAALFLMWCYVLLVGMPLSAVRAALMITVFFIVRLSSTKASLEHCLYITAFLILLFRPVSLFDVGFQMSFAAVLGIGKFASPLTKILYDKYNKERKKQRDNRRAMSGNEIRKQKCFLFLKRMIVWVVGCIAVSCAAQIMVLPLTAHYFGVISCYSVFTSLLVSVCAVAIVVAGISLLLITAFCPGFISDLLSSFLIFVVDVQHAFLRFVVSLPGAYVDNVTISVAQVVLLYVIIMSLYIILRRLLPPLISLNK